MCESVATTINVSVDEKGQIKLLSLEGENLTEDMQESISRAVNEINSYVEANGKKVLAASMFDSPVQVSYSFPFVRKGKGYHLYETFYKQDQPYKVFRSCNNYYIKEGDKLECQHQFQNETDYLDFKEAFLSDNLEDKEKKKKIESDSHKAS